MLSTLLDLHKQGIDIYMTEEGWKQFVQMLSETVLPEETEEVV